MWEARASLPPSIDFIPRDDDECEAAGYDEYSISNFFPFEKIPKRSSYPAHVSLNFHSLMKLWEEMWEIENALYQFDR